MLKSGFASGFDQPSGQDHPLSRRTFLLGLSSFLALGLPGRAEAQAGFAPFSFAFISDVHLCTGLSDTTALLQESQLFLQDVVKQLNGLKLDFVIFGGDNVEGPGKDDVFWNLFIDCLQILNAPWYFILGEADVSGRTLVDKMVEFGPDFKGRGLTSGKPYWSADPLPGVHLIGLDTSKPNTTTGDLSQDQLNWLKTDLQANRGKFTFVASHHPLLAPPPYDGGPPWDDYMVLQGASAREILGGSRDVRLCVSGHVPVNKVQQEGNIWYVSSSTLSIYPCQFKIFTVSPQAVHVETLTISYGALVKKAKKMMETSRLAFQYSSSRPETFLRIAEGEEIDRNALLPLVSGAVSKREEKKKEKKPKRDKKEEKAEKAEKTEKAGKSDKSSKDGKSHNHESGKEDSGKDGKGSSTGKSQDSKNDLQPSPAKNSAPADAPKAVPQDSAPGPSSGPGTSSNVGSSSSSGTGTGTGTGTPQTTLPASK